MKPLNGILQPFEALKTSTDDLGALAQLAEEDSSLDPELEQELSAIETRLDEFELRAVMSGPQDSSNAYVKIQAGAGGTEACDWAQMLVRTVYSLGRAPRLQGRLDRRVAQ